MLSSRRLTEHHIDWDLIRPQAIRPLTVLGQGPTFRVAAPGRSGRGQSKDLADGTAGPVACHLTSSWLQPARLPSLRVKGRLDDGRRKLFCGGPHCLAQFMARRGSFQKSRDENAIHRNSSCDSSIRFRSPAPFLPPLAIDSSGRVRLIRTTSAVLASPVPRSA